jgi:putative methionine-R-sulfoxide reductase with GAF domain
MDLLHRAPVWRDYPGLLRAASLDPATPPPPVAPSQREGAMRRAIELLWGVGRETGVSWIGFYEKSDGVDEMVLVCREPKPACSPIGLQGMCGRGWKERAPIIIPDVRTLGANYIACDPKDQSELVVPCLDARGACWGVLDADSYDIGAFDEHDAQGMTKVLVALGLTTPDVLSMKALRL